MANCQEISRDNLIQLLRNNTGLHEDVHLQTSIDKGKLITHFLNVTAYTDNSVIIKVVAIFQFL